METLEYILKKFGYSYRPFLELPVEIPEFDRNKLASLFHELGFKSGAEIGVEQGVYSDVLLRENPDLFLYLVDAWQVYKGYRDHTRQDKLNKYMEITVERLVPYSSRYMIIRNFSMEAIKSIADESLDFVYIDANHDFKHVTEDIFEWSKKVRKGGIVSGHDYYIENIPSHVHVPYVLQGYTKAYNISPWFIFDDSWMFIKE